MIAFVGMDVILLSEIRQTQKISTSLAHSYRIQVRKSYRWSRVMISRNLRREEYDKSDKCVLH